MIKLSAGTAHVLGLKKLTTDALPTTAYMMLGEKCSHDCGFCPQARNSSGRADLLSRVTWSEAVAEDVIEVLAAAYQKGSLKRACLQVVDSAAALSQIKLTASKIKSSSDIPLCVSAKVKNKEEMLELAEAGVDRIGLALDAACERVFKLTKTGSWEHTLGQIEEAAQILPSRISTHLIVGLGETEQEMVAMLQKMHELQVTVGLFAFTPVPGTKMAIAKPPELSHYRRMQAAHYLISKGYIKVTDCKFSAGQLIDYGLSREQLAEYLKAGKAFETSGCADCNRPYYNEKPGGTIYNYPRPLTAQEINKALDLLPG